MWDPPFAASRWRRLFLDSGALVAFPGLNTCNVWPMSEPQSKERREAKDAGHVTQGRRGAHARLTMCGSKESARCIDAAGRIRPSSQAVQDAGFLPVEFLLVHSTLQQSRLEPHGWTNPVQRLVADTR